MPPDESISAIDPLQRRFGYAIHRLGVFTFPACVGAALGFYLADQGTRWLPTMVGLLLLVGALALLAISGGRAMQGKAFRKTAEGRVVRRRVVIAATLAMAAGVARLSLFWVQQSSPLTELSREDFDETFLLDAQNYREYDNGLEHQLTLLEARPELFTSDQVLSADDELLVLDTWESIYAYAFALDQIRIFYEDWYRFDPSRAQRSRHLRSFLLTFAAELALYEKATRVIQLFRQNPNVVKFLDAPHLERDLGENTFSTFRQELQGSRDATRVIAGSQYLRWLATALDGRAEARAAGVDDLWQRIERHLAVIEGLGVIDSATRTAGSDLQLLRRGVRRVWYPAQKGVAEWMGDTRVRRVGWYLIDEPLQAGLETTLEPGDVLLARKNWYVSNVGLPGFWPHAILYIGDADKLGAYFDDPEVRDWLRAETGEDIDLPTYLARQHGPHWYQYLAGHDGQPYRVIEAISEGVVFNSLDHCVGDYVAALRPKLSKLAKAQAIVAAFGFLDRPYDFDFDFATDHALVCTELVWRAYRPAEGKDGLLLPLAVVAGRQTLPANDIAALFAREAGSEHAQFDFIYFIDAVEKQHRAVVSDEAAFLGTHTRTKWDYRKQ